MTTLAEFLRPNSFEDYIGQSHLIGKGKILTQLLAHRIPSMILYGPPGIGKTTLASLIAHQSQKSTYFFNATTDNKKKLQQLINEATLFNHSLLIVDECHRLTKPVQELLLSYVEQDKLTFIGLTTENPNISIVKALRSRCYLFELKPLTEQELQKAFSKVENAIEFFNCKKIIIDQTVQETISRITQGDVRQVYQILEIALYNLEDQETKHLTQKDLSALPLMQNLATDCNQSEHYALISALQKSIRGSDVNSALHYLSALLEAGDLTTLCRRLLVIAFEDIGIANPNIMARAYACIQSAEYLGLPEARIPLADLVVDMSLSPKSNSPQIAIDQAIDHLHQYGIGKIPDYLRTGHSKEYTSPHKSKNGWNAQNYWPENLDYQYFYQPKETSRYEQALKQQYNKINHLKPF